MEQHLWLLKVSAFHGQRKHNYPRSACVIYFSANFSILHGLRRAEDKMAKQEQFTVFLDCQSFYHFSQNEQK